MLGCIDTLGTESTADDRTFIYAYDGQGNVTQLIETTARPNYDTVAASYADRKSRLPKRSRPHP